MFKSLDHYEIYQIKVFVYRCLSNFNNANTPSGNMVVSGS